MGQKCIKTVIRRFWLEKHGKTMIFFALTSHNPYPCFSNRFKLAYLGNFGPFLGTPGPNLVAPRSSKLVQKLWLGPPIACPIFIPCCSNRFRKTVLDFICLLQIVDCEICGTINCFRSWQYPPLLWHLPVTLSLTFSATKRQKIQSSRHQGPVGRTIHPL